MTEKKTRIIVAENKELFRKALSALLETNPGFEVIAQASTGKELLHQLKHMPADIVLLDRDLPMMDGNAILKILHTRFRELKVIILSNHSSAQLQSDFMANGANCFLSKDISSETLFTAIEKVSSDGFFFDNSTSRALLDKVLQEKHRSSRSPEIRFNDRETEILKRICDGNTNKEIASSLHLSASTIDFYKTKIYHKTNCNNATGLLKYALRNGLVALH